MGILQRTTILFLLILFLASILRLVNVETVPVGLDWDEAAVGYNAYSILKTGKDEYGNPWPLTFTSFGDGKLPMIVYATVPSVAAFGLTPFAVRFPTILIGLATVFLTFFLTRAIFRRESIALSAMFLLAISPWHLHFSRVGFEPTWATFFIVLSLFLWWKGIKEPKWFVLSAATFGLSLYTYHSVKVFLPLMLLLLFIIHRRILLQQKKLFSLAVAVFILLAIPAGISTLMQPQSRLAQTSIINHPSEIEKINARRRDDNKSSFPFPLAWHNKLTQSVGAVTERYMSHFSPEYLFSGERVNFRLGLRDYGKLHLFELPLLLIGGYVLLRKRDRVSAFLFGWLAIGILPGSFGTEFPHALRTLISVPAWQITAALGGIELYGWLRRRVRWYPYAVVVAGVVVVWSLAVYVHEYHIHFKYYGSFDWQDTHKEMVQYVRENRENYDRVIVTDRLFQPHIFYAFYNQLDPAWYQREMLRPENDPKHGVVRRLGNVFFKQVSWSAVTKTSNTLLIGSLDEVRDEVPRLKEFVSVDGHVLFYAVKI